MRRRPDASVIRRGSAAIAVLAIPLVWAIGYQDHSWRQPGLAILLGVLLSASALILHLRGNDTPAVARWSTFLAVAIAVASLFAALFWWWINRF